MTILIQDFQMPDEIKGTKITLKRVDKNDITTIQNISEALFSGQTSERIKQTMASFADSPEDLQSIIKTLNQCFQKNGFNYFIFRGLKAVGQIYGYPCCGSAGKTPVSIWGWISDNALRHGYMKEAVQLVENEHFLKSSEPLEMYAHSNLIVDSFAKAVNFKTQDKSGTRSYFRIREEWLNEQQPRVIMSHEEHKIVSQNIREGRE